MKSYPISKEANINGDKPLVVAINAYDSGSTGMIAISTLNKYEQNGFQTLLVCDEPKGNYKNEYRIGGSFLYRQSNRVLCRIDGSDGFHNKRATKKLLSYLETKNVVAFHLHNIHSFYLNLPLVLNFAKEKQIPVIWTIHDCWFFTGRCSHFQECLNWQKQCGNCPNRQIYPRAILFDKSDAYLEKKLHLIAGLKSELVVACPSKWIERELSRSRFAQVKHLLIYNGFPLNCSLEDKKTSKKIRLLFIASPFNERKGLRYVERLSRDLPSERFEFHIVGDLVGNCSFGANAKLYGKISDRELFFSIVKSCDVFINPTLDDTFPTTNIEALSKGLPVITFDTGGSGEAIDKETGVLVKKGDYQGLKEAILKFEPKRSIAEKCIDRASLFSEEKMCDSYMALLSSLLKAKCKSSE